MTEKKEIIPHSLEAWLSFMRPKTFWIAAIPVLVGTGLSMALNGRLNLMTFFLTLLGAVSIQALSNMQNDYGYNARKAERSNRTGLPRATTMGWISMRAARNMIASTTLFACILIIPLIMIGGWPILGIAALSLLCAYFYMAGPLPISYTPAGEFLVLVFYGWAAVGGSYWLQTHEINWVVMICGTAIGLFGAAVLFVNNFRDIEHDTSVGRKTLPAVLGKKTCYWVYSAMVYLPFLLIGWLIPIHEQYWPLLFVLLTLPRASFLPGKFIKSSGFDCNAVMFGTVKLEFLFGLLLSLGLLAIAFLGWPTGTIAQTLLSNPF